MGDGQSPRALLADFGLNTVISDPFSLVRESTGWTAPELLTPENALYQPSVTSDIYALAMTIYEVSVTSPSVVTGSNQD